MNSQNKIIVSNSMILHHVTLMNKIKEAIENSPTNQTIKIDLISKDKKVRS